MTPEQLAQHARLQQQIALWRQAAVAELQAVRASCQGKPLGDLPTSIHTHEMGKSLQEVRPIDQHVVELQPSEEGLTVLSLYSGISTEVEAALRAGLTVAHYYAVEVSVDARRVSQYRLEQLHRLYPI